MGEQPDQLTSEGAGALHERLRAALPAASPEDLAVLAAYLGALARGLPPSEETRAALGARPHLAALAGAARPLIALGDGAQAGDISIQNAAGRDIITNTTIVGDEAFNVGGLASPYRGLEPFDFGDAASYAGRDEERRQALRALTTPGDERALLYIIGASGSGKSSFARACLAPALDAHYRRMGEATALAACTPGPRPLAALAAALRRLGRRADGPFAPAKRWMQGAPAPIPEPPPLAVLVIDQLEELFSPRCDPAERDALLDILAGLPPFGALRAHILVTLRIDFLPELAGRAALFDQARFGLWLQHMQAEGLREAIALPLRRAYPEKRFEPALLARLAADASGDATSLPLLQASLRQIWARGRLTLDGYSSLAGALAADAEEVLRRRPDGGERPPQEREALLAILLDLVEVDLRRDARWAVRRPQPLRALVAAGGPERARLIGELEAARLIVKDAEHLGAGEPEVVVKLIHESLITGWERLREAVEGQKDRLRRRVRFEHGLAEWRGSGERDAYLLGGVRLAEAQALADDHDVALAAPAARDFLGRSVELRAAAERRAEALRRRAEIANLIGGVGGSGLGYAIGITLAIVGTIAPQVRPERIPSYIVLCLLYLFSTGVIGGVAVAAGLWLGPQGRGRTAVVAGLGAVANGLALPLVIWGPFQSPPLPQHVLAGAVLGAAVGAAAVVPGWRRVLALAGAAGAALLAVALLGWIAVSPALAVAGGLILGAVMGLGFYLSSPAAGGQP